MRHTKIVATLGPASSSTDVLDSLIGAGVDCFRLNFSHGTRQSHRTAVERVRQSAARAGRIVSVMQDLSGPKIRTGPLEGGGPVELDDEARLTIATGDFEGDASRVSTSEPLLAASVGPGDTLLLDDGQLQLEVEGVDGSEIRTRVRVGGKLGERKGISAPNVMLRVDAMTEKDARDLAFGVELGVDMVAVSFVQSAADVERVRDAQPDDRRGVPLIAKIERPGALDVIDDILDASDGVMVARGDLGLELPLEHVPRAQKEITRRARSAGVPVILATQVLESMRRQPRPTRAEVSDAANAVADGVDAIMLAGETAAGTYPVESVETLHRVIVDAEADCVVSGPARRRRSAPTWHGPSLCEAAVTLARGGQADAIVAVTRGGETARMLSGLRPDVPVFAATHDEDVARRLTLRWGIMPLVLPLDDDIDATGALVERELLRRGFVASGAAVIVVNVAASIGSDATNFLKLSRVAG